MGFPEEQMAIVSSGTVLRTENPSAVLIVRKEKCPWLDGNCWKNGCLAG
jgi:hypothetical protein